MFNSLERVREKPKSERQVIALSIAAIITGIIFILWIVSFFASIQGKQDTVVTPSESGFGFDTFVNSFQEASDTIKQEVGSAKEQFGLISTELQKIEENDSVELTTIIEEESEEIPIVEESEIIKDTVSEITPSGIEIIRVEE